MQVSKPHLAPRKCSSSLPAYFNHILVKKIHLDIVKHVRGLNRCLTLCQIGDKTRSKLINSVIIYLLQHTSFLVTTGNTCWSQLVEKAYLTSHTKSTSALQSQMG